MTIDKNYTVGVWDCTFYLVDEDGNELLNDDGSVKEFYSNKIDMSYWADGIDPDDLKALDWAYWVDGIDPDDSKEIV